MGHLLNLGPGDYYKDGWINLEPVGSPVRAEYYVDFLQPFAQFRAGSTSLIYMGHVLEHVPWEELPGILADAKRVLTTDGLIGVMLPDVHAAIQLYGEGQMSWEKMLTHLEHEWYDSDGWPGARHHWNAHPARAQKLLEDCGYEVSRYRVTTDTMPGRWHSAVVDMSNDTHQFFLEAKPLL